MEKIMLSFNNDIAIKEESIKRLEERRRIGNMPEGMLLNFSLPDDISQELENIPTHLGLTMPFVYLFEEIRERLDFIKESHFSLDLLKAMSIGVNTEKILDRFALKVFSSALERINLSEVMNRQAIQSLINCITYRYKNYKIPTQNEWLEIAYKNAFCGSTMWRINENALVYALINSKSNSTINPTYEKNDYKNGRDAKTIAKTLVFTGLICSGADDLSKILIEICEKQPPWPEPRRIVRGRGFVAL